MRRLSVGLLALLLVMLAACTAEEPEQEQSVRDVAEDVAAALSAEGQVDWQVDGDADVTARYEEIVAGMGEVEPAIEVTEVTVENATATATLAWSWPVGRGDDRWEYDATLDLARSEDRWVPIWSPALVEPGLTRGEELSVTTVPSERGDVTGHGGAVLVTERPVRRYGIDRVRVSGGQAVAAARRLARLTGIEVAPYVDSVRKAGDRAFVEAITYRKGEVPARVQATASEIDGVLIVADDIALAPTREFAAPILGRVGPVTAEMVEEEPETYRAGDVAGVSGLQARYDDRLRGRVGVLVEASHPKKDQPARELYRTDAQPGDDLALSLDAGLQRRAESLLTDIDSSAALVAVRPSDGAVLAAANGPGTGGQNHATFGQFAPGSTFKIVSSLALLRADLTPASTVACPPAITVDGKRFENYDGYPSDALGQVPLRTAIAESCNTAVIGQRDRLDDEALADAAASLGAGVDHELGFPAYFGAVPPPASETEKAADLIGQGKVLASPMTMAAVIASVQQGGTVVPWLVEGKTAEAGGSGLTGAEAGQLRTMLRQAVTDGSASDLADVPGPPVIAKTGTAEFEGDQGLQTHAWMVAAQGDLAVAVFVEIGDSGSQTAGPVLEAFLRAA
jgi:cell division protein FtsI/penicillin-binding protein 2